MRTVRRKHHTRKGITMLKFTKAQAIDEITYRAIPKPRPARDFVAGDASQASGAELRTKAGEAKPARKAPKAARKAPAVKAPKAPKVLTPAEQVSRLVGKAAQAKAAAEDGPGFVKRVIAERKALLSAGDLAEQAHAALTMLAAYGDLDAIAALELAGLAG